MSHEINDGGPAFPADIQRRDPVTTEWGDMPPQGMTLRDYFAGQALAGMVANPDIEIMRPHEYASDAYLYADAMMKARATAPQQGEREKQ